jgi:A/G-specific adenine glycosylase
MLDIPALRAALLAWYDAQARDLPWRTGPALGRRARAIPIGSGCRR